MHHPYDLDDPPEVQAAAIISWNNRASDNGDERVRLSFARDGM